MFGNTNTNNGGLFGNNNTNITGGTQSINPFLINNNQQTSSIFLSNNNNNIINNNFLNNNNNQNSQISSLFGNNNNGLNTQNIFLNNNNQRNIFTNNNNNNGLFNNNINTGVLFGVNNNNNQSGLFINNNNNINFNQNNNLNINNDLPNTTFFTTINPVIALNQNNSLKYVQFGKFPIEIQKAVLNLKMNLKTQRTKLDELKRYSKRLTDLMEQNSKSAEKIGNYNDVLDQKLNKCENKIKEMENKFDFISESFEKEEKNIKLMEQDPANKIEIPSKFLVDYSQNLYNRTLYFKQKLDDIITLIKISYSECNGDFEFKSDIFESTLAEFVKIVRLLLEANAKQEIMVNEMFQILLKFANDHGENPETIYNNVIQYSMEYES